MLRCIKVAVSDIRKCLNASTICRKAARCDKKLCVVLIEADIFDEAVQENIPKPLRNLYTKFDVNTLRHCGEMACAEEHLHTFGNSDIATLAVEIDLHALPFLFCTLASLRLSMACSVFTWGWLEKWLQWTPLKSGHPRYNEQF